MLTNILGPAASALVAPSASQAANTVASGQSFLDLVNGALQGVSATQGAAATAEASYAAGVPGASLGKALVASDRAQVAWNATVAVRNEVVSAYQSIMNMQF
ncbi:MAG: flagellar hook-basal body complex protein FliE [Acidocella sp. 20-61-6]|nr:MAG: flagellar hook-basal body complex protein FliE [Acidocella sp. 20-61-6]